MSSGNKVGFSPIFGVPPPCPSKININLAKTMYEGDAQNCIPFLAAETLKTVYSFHPSHSTQLNETLRANHFFASPFTKCRIIATAAYYEWLNWVRSARKGSRLVQGVSSACVRTLRLGWLRFWFWCPTILPSRFCQTLTSPGRLGQKVEQTLKIVINPTLYTRNGTPCTVFWRHRIMQSNCVCLPPAKRATTRTDRQITSGMTEREWVSSDRKGEIHSLPNRRTTCVEVQLKYRAFLLELRTFLISFWLLKITVPYDDIVG